MTTSYAVDIEGLEKNFGSTRALDGLNLTIETGTVAGFLGPNGSGKTTTIRILLGLLRADGGHATLLGGDPWKDAVELHRRIAKHEDAGHGTCVLRDPENAAIIQQTLIKNHPDRYQLIDWCIMPNHVHVLVRILKGHPLSQVIQQWKGSSSVQINRLLKRSGRLWEPDFHDRYIRDERHFNKVRRYIHNNPVKADLCKEPEDWPFSSIGIAWQLERGL